MRFRIGWVAACALATSGLVALVAACSDDEAAAPTPSGVDASTSDTGTPTGNDSGEPIGDGGAETGNDAATPQPVQYTVPTGGGSVDFSGTATKLTFVFPASAAGKVITLTPRSSADVGWPAGQFVEVIEMAPNGERFADPIVVKPEKKELVTMLLSVPDGSSKGPASQVPLNSAGDGFLVSHFSSLIIVGPGRVCDSEGYNDTASAPGCSDAGPRTTQRTVTCKGYSYCLNTSISCCIDPTVDAGPGCTWDDSPFTGTYQPTDSNGGAYPYCDGDAGEWDGGTSSCNGANPKPFYQWNGAGCTMLRDCSLVYRMQCDGGTCECAQVSGSTVSTGSFAQGAACDNTATMREAYVQKCNYPLAQ